MSIEIPDANLELKSRVNDLLTKSRDRLQYLNSFDQKEKKAYLDRMGREASDLERDSYQNVETGKVIIKRIIEQLENAHSALEIGRTNATPTETVEDVLQKTERTWVREFEVPERLPDESAEDALRRHLRKNP